MHQKNELSLVLKILQSHRFHDLSFKTKIVIDTEKKKKSRK